MTFNEILFSSSENLTEIKNNCIKIWHKANIKIEITKEMDSCQTYLNIYSK